MADVTALDAPIRPLTAPERRRMWSAFASGYLAVGRNRQVVERHCREWCRLLGRPFVVVRRRGRLADVEMPTTTLVAMHDAVEGGDAPCLSVS